MKCGSGPAVAARGVLEVEGCGRGAACDMPTILPDAPAVEAVRCRSTLRRFNPGQAGRMRPPVVLADVARAAGVSLSTASLAIRGHRRVATATRQRVLDAARKLGWRPDPLVSALAERRWRGHGSRLLLLVDDRDYFGDFERRLGTATAAAAAALGYRLKRCAPAAVPRHRAVGALLNVVRTLDTAPWRIPVVACGYGVAPPDLPAVLPDPLHGMELALTHLAGERIGFATLGPRDFTESRLREAAIGIALARPGLELAEPPVFRGERPRAFASWVRAARPTAIICANDGFPWKLREQDPLRARRLRWFSLSREAASRDWPGCNADPERIGQRAVELLHRAIVEGSRGGSAGERVLVPGTFVAAGS
jgi:LacI family transcriptional regulator